MVGAGEHAEERHELERVLASDIFDRAPSLGQVLAYVCQKYFEGSAHELKEYNIALDALGRSADFDQKKDSIVRVQMHRLREKLADFYANDGASHPIIIEIPQGQYAPRFTLKEVPDATEELRPVTAIHVALPAPTLAPPVSAGPVVDQARPARIWLWIGMLATIALVMLTVKQVAMTSNVPVHPPAPVAAVSGDAVRIMAGAARGFTDGYGNIWGADRDFEGGDALDVEPPPIRGTRDPQLYRARRQGEFSYHIPLKPGVYELKLHFAEVNYGETNIAGHGGEGSRAFAIEINGKRVLERLDVIGEAGAANAHIRAFKDVSPGDDGKLHIKFDPIVSVPFVNAIEITPGTAGTLRPIRIIMQDRPYTDPKGNVWTADRMGIGGQVVKHPPLEGAPDPNLFAGERFGNLSYLFPVPPGRYTVNLYMTERFVGRGMSGGVGTRMFDILANGVMLSHDLDVFKRTGGMDKPLVQTFRGLEPNHQGYIALSLVPNKNFPLVSAIEVLDEAR